MFFYSFWILALSALPVIRACTPSFKDGTQFQVVDENRKTITTNGKANSPPLKLQIAGGTAAPEGGFILVNTNRGANSATLLQLSNDEKSVSFQTLPTSAVQDKKQAWFISCDSCSEDPAGTKSGCLFNSMQNTRLCLQTAGTGSTPNAFAVVNCRDDSAGVAKQPQRYSITTN
ncbi:hypothetical protein Moror_2380 [Moniliophthora roreri MCA 2997]|uniref:Uncharacterized protein n=2 Tax=Moniliophthora roreri TaxID=221103 RepID=V2X062_MONRO|nr:hypothetical protein Moror_2380 [Moniliophthora roreri MCA 2997]